MNKTFSAFKELTIHRELRPAGAKRDREQEWSGETCPSCVLQGLLGNYGAGDGSLIG